ncbi:MAG: alpha-(1-_3)-arabinofuranosyltransferase domain-containing protein [Acidimicrobiales bacterium]
MTKLSRTLHVLGRHKTLLFLGFVAYVPLLATHPGRLNADTKQLLYLNPGRLIRNAPYMWDSSTGMGTVTHQNIGYLFPTGPFFWVGEFMGLADWVTQRLWMGSLLFIAGAGMLVLWRTLGLRNEWAGLVAALAYQLSPYTLGYITGTSVILLPWAGLPILLALTIRATRRGGWRHPALIALVVTTVGAVNASSLLYVALAVMLWMPCAVWATKEVSWRQATGTSLRIGLLVGVTQLWWLVALMVDGRYGLPILRTTETVQQVAATSSAPEILRGLGYWFFYGGDNGGLWLPFSKRYEVRPVILGISLLIPLLALVVGTMMRWRYRFYVAVLILVGTVLASGAFPYANPSPLGRAFRDAAAQSDFILSLRNTQRATPLVALGVALLLGAGLCALTARQARLGALATVFVGALVAANFSPLWTGDLVSERFNRPEDIPNYWNEAAASLDARGNSTRILEVPGSDFAAYRWGHTLDPITSGLTDRPMVARELVPMGSPGTVSLLNALDRRMQEGTLDPAGIAPVARLMGAGDVLTRFDLEYERYRTPRPWLAWALFSPPPPGLGPPLRFGPSAPINRAVESLPLIDEITLATEPVPTKTGSTEPALTEPPPLAVFPVTDPLPIIHSRPTNRMQTVDGDGEGIVEAAEVGLIDPDASLLYAGSLAGDRGLNALATAGENDLIITDTNRRRAQRWFGLRENGGYTEYIGEKPLRVDPADARIPLFSNSNDSTATVITPKGGISASATSYGDPIRYAPHARPSRAIDANPETAWVTGAFSSVIGERIVVSLDKPVTSEHVTLLQPQGGRDRFITQVRLTFDERNPVDVDLDEDSLRAPGQLINLSERTFSTLGVEILSDGLATGSNYSGLDGVGFAEIRIGGFSGAIDEVTRLPTELLSRVKNDLQHRMAIVVARQRSNPREPVLQDSEEAMVRSFTLPSTRTFELSGSARISAHAPDPVIDDLVGIPLAEGGGVTASSSGRLSGEVRARSSAALDGDPSTHWSPGFLQQEGHWVQYAFSTAQTFDRLDLQVVRDGRHSVPTRLLLSGSDGETREVTLPTLTGPVSALDVPTPTTVHFPAMTTDKVTITILATEPTTTIDWYTNDPIAMPVAIAEIGIPGVQLPPASGVLAFKCRNDLITIDNKSYPVRISGLHNDALNRDGLRIEPCGTEPLTLTKGEHEIRTSPGKLSGFDLDRLVLTSAQGGAGETIEAWVTKNQQPYQAKEAPRLTVTTHSPTKRSIKVAPGRAREFWLVLGESQNKGWQANMGGHILGPSRLIDGFANGWLVTAPASNKPFVIDLEWTPQRTVWRGIQASLLGLVVCLGILIASFTRRRKTVDPVGSVLTLDDDPQVDRPQFEWPIAWQGNSPSLYVVALAMFLIGAIGYLISRPIIGLAASALVGISLTIRNSRSLLSFATFTTFGLSASLIGISQLRHNYPSDSTWPGRFETMHWLGLTAVFFLLVHTLIDRLRDTENTRERSALLKRLTASPRSRHFFAGAVGSFTGSIVFTWMLTAGSWELFSWQKMGGFYDAQAHALLNGKWDVPQQALGIESFTIDGKSYLYQGPIPALFRLPFLMFSDHLDGRLTQLSMLVAYVVIMAVISHLAWRIRGMIRGDEPVTTLELLGIGFFMALLGGGSSLVYLASRAWVYHEALMWGVAFSLAGINALIGYIEKPTWRRLALVSLLTTAALGSRISIGLGPLAGLSLACGLSLLKLKPWRVLSEQTSFQQKVETLKKGFVLGVAPLIPLGLYVLVNFVKFQTLFSVPFAYQGFTLVDPTRQQMLAANNGTLFGLKFIPTTLWHYIDPTALSISRRFPFVDFPPIPGKVIGDVQFDLIDRTGSVPATLSILCLLALLGIIAILRFRRITETNHPSLRTLWIPLFGVIASGITILPFGYIAHRYLADLFPFFILTGLTGFHVLARQRFNWVRLTRAAVIVTACLGLFTAGINLSLAAVFQRSYSSDIPAGVVAGFVGFQQDIDSWTGRRLGGFRPPSVQVHDELPITGASGSLVIVGNCDGLYLNDGMMTNSVKRTPWVPVERTGVTGLHRAKMRFSKRPIGTNETIVNFQDGSNKAAVTAMYLNDGHMKFELSGSSRFGFLIEMLPVPIKIGHTYLLEVVADPRMHSLIVMLDDRVVLETFYWYQGKALSFPPGFQEVPVKATLCQKVRAAAGFTSSS